MEEYEDTDEASVQWFLKIFPLCIHCYKKKCYSPLVQTTNGKYWNTRKEAWVFSKEQNVLHCPEGMWGSIRNY